MTSCVCSLEPTTEMGLLMLGTSEHVFLDHRQRWVPRSVHVVNMDCSQLSPYSHESRDDLRHGPTGPEPRASSRSRLSLNKIMI
ncbi:hypothetical protein TNCV_4810621 [Trichonephila clavipes]|nr:hypothetical protein TNCV_4810621 [Trichonephila clavipes]